MMVFPSISTASRPYLAFYIQVQHETRDMLFKYRSNQVEELAKGSRSVARGPTELHYTVLLVLTGGLACVAAGTPAKE